jgi:hypothetical protein
MSSSNTNDENEKIKLDIWNQPPKQVKSNTTLPPFSFGDIPKQAKFTTTLPPFSFGKRPISYCQWCGWSDYTDRFGAHEENCKKRPENMKPAPRPNMYEKALKEAKEKLTEEKKAMAEKK